MTSTTDMTEHPDVAEISDLTEGLLTPDRTADVRRHLDRCDLCADVHASLKEIRDLLGTMPSPPSMPAEIAGRIDAALAAEALLQASAPGAKAEAAPESPAPADAPADPAEPAVPADATSDDVQAGDDTEAQDADVRASVSRETSPPADRPAGRARPATTGPGRKSPARRGRRRVAVLGTVFTVAALGLGSVLLSSMNGTKDPDEGGQTTMDTFSAARLEKQVSDLLSRSEPKAGGSRTPHTFGQQETEGGAPSPRVLKQPSVPACVQDGIGRDDAALAAEQGTYEGKEAMLVVLPDLSDDARVTAYIVDATCVENPSSADRAKVLLKHSYARS